MKKRMTHVFLFCSLLCLCNLTAYAAMDTGMPTFTSKQMEMRTSTRSLFATCLIWQRIFAVETLAGALDATKAQVRLQQSQGDINGIFKNYFGDPTGTQVSDLFNQYIGLIIDYANAARNRGDKTTILNKIHDKANEIAALLSMVNMNWTNNDLSIQLNKYSDSFLHEIDLQDTSMGSIDTKLFDATFDQSMQLADTFCLGIIKQYPAKFW